MNSKKNRPLKLKIILYLKKELVEVPFQLFIKDIIKLQNYRLP